MGDPVGDAVVSEFHELGGHAVQLEGLIDIVLPDDALRVALLNPPLPDLGQLDFHHSVASSSVARARGAIHLIQFPKQ